MLGETKLIWSAPNDRDRVNVSENLGLTGFPCVYAPNLYQSTCRIPSLTMVFSLFSILFIFRLHWWIIKKICPKMKCQIPKLILGTIPSSQKFSSKFWLQFFEKFPETIALAFGIANLCTYFFFVGLWLTKWSRTPTPELWLDVVIWRTANEDSHSSSEFEREKKNQTHIFCIVCRT